MRRIGPGSNEVPVAVPLSVVLARTDDVALALVAAQVYSNGLSFDLAARARSSMLDAAGRQLLNQVLGHWPEVSDTRLLIGVEFSDGRRASNVSRHAPDSELVFHPRGGGGDALAVDQSWWLSPLPPDGPLRVVVRCPAIGIAETSVVLDGSVIRRAAEGVTELWPYEPPRPEPVAELRPDLPTDSWFASTP